MGETRGRIARDCHNFAVRPLGRGPIRRAVKRDLMAGIRNGTPEAFQVRFGAAGPGKPSTNKTNFYATSARIGGYGLDAVAYETLVGIRDRLGLALAYGNRAEDLRRSPIRSLAWHPVRLLSNLESRYYYDAKKKALDHVASRFLRTG